MIKAQGIVKIFGLRPVLRGIDLTIEQGEFLTLFGPNGAGKTTFMRILATLTRPTAGVVQIGNYMLPSIEARAQIGLVSHSPLLYGDLSAQENLEFYARIYDVNDRTRIAALLETVGLTPRADDLVRTFSRGMLQRLAIARSILHNPSVLLLDEPYTGLDQDAAATLNTVLADVATSGRTVMMTTHNIARGLASADRIAILSRGEIAYEGQAADHTPLSFADTYADITGMATIR